MDYSGLSYPQEATIRPDSLAVLLDADRNGGETTIPAEDPHGLVADLRYNALATTSLDLEDYTTVHVRITNEAARVLGVLESVRK